MLYNLKLAYLSRLISHPLPELAHTLASQLTAFHDSMRTSLAPSGSIQMSFFFLSSLSMFPTRIQCSLLQVPIAFIYAQLTVLMAIRFMLLVCLYICLLSQSSYYHIRPLKVRTMPYSS